MGGGGGGASYRDWNTDQLSQAVREDSEKASTEFEATLAEYLNELLGLFNGRDVVLTRERLDEAVAALEDGLERSIDQLFGGSVAKHTYVDGLSDVDALIVLNGKRFPRQFPTEVLEDMATTLKQNLNTSIAVTTGQMAVTLTYPDGMVVQLLPALPTETGMKVPSFLNDGWSEINPEAFQQALVRRNGECGGKLIPTIKLAKAVISNVPERYRLTGYHVESLAIAAFKNYEGIKIPARMLPFLFDRSKELVLSPIRDKTGQSVHVDAYLGPENSELRKQVSHVFGGIAKRMRNASAAQSKDLWSELLQGE
jgi:hypothetical protein